MWCPNITLFKSITMFCGVDNIPHNIFGYFPHSNWITPMIPICLKTVDNNAKWWDDNRCHHHHHHHVVWCMRDLIFFHMFTTRSLKCWEFDIFLHEAYLVHVHTQRKKGGSDSSSNVGSKYERLLDMLLFCGRILILWDPNPTPFWDLFPWVGTQSKGAYV